MKYYAVIDTNVLVSAMLKWNSVPGSILELVFAGPIVPLLHKEIVDEYKEVLSRPKFHLTNDIIEDVLTELREKGIFVDSEELPIEFQDSKDAIFYEVVMEERKTEDAYLITGNIKHFPNKPFVVTPKEMLNIIINDNFENDN